MVKQLLVKQFYLTNRILTDTAAPGQSGLGINSNEVVLYIHLSSRTGASSSDSLVSNLGHSEWGRSPLQRWSRHILQPKLSGLQSDSNPERSWAPQDLENRLVGQEIKERIKKTNPNLIRPTA